MCVFFLASQSHPQPAAAPHTRSPTHPQPRTPAAPHKHTHARTHYMRSIVGFVFNIAFCLAGLGSVLVLVSIAVGNGSLDQPQPESVSAATLATITFFGIFLGGPALALRMCSLLASFVCVLFMISSSYEHNAELVALSQSIHAYTTPVHEIVDEHVQAGRLNLILHHLARGPGDSIFALAAAKHMAQSFKSFVEHARHLANAFHTFHAFHTLQPPPLITQG